MSRAFVKEADGPDIYDELPDRPIDPHPNLVTARGLALIEDQIARLRAALADAERAEDRGAIAEVSRDLRYWNARRSTAEVIVPPTDNETVRFGLRVTIERDDGRRPTFDIVGLDEADPTKGSISYASPLALALTGKRVGDVVKAGAGEVEIIAIEKVPDESRARVERRNGRSPR